jgi:hypothetical protein
MRPNTIEIAGLFLVSLLSGCTLKPNVQAVRALLHPLPPPVLASATPSAVFTGGGATLALTGTGFTQGIKISVGGQDCPLTGTFSSTKMSCLTPALAAGTYDISVTSYDDQSSSLAAAIQTAPDAFTRVDLVAGSLGVFTGAVDGVEKSVRFNNTTGGIISDGTYFYVADTMNNWIRRIDPLTGIVKGISGSPTLRYGAFDTGVDANCPQGCYWYPSALALSSGSLYVLDSEREGAIQMLDFSSSVITTYAGSTVDSGDADHPSDPKQARFNYPWGMTLQDGVFYITDGNDTIRRIIQATGEVSTLAGISGNNGYADGVGASAQFYTPVGIVQLGGALYIADYGNRAIRRLDLNTRAVTTVAGDPAIYPHESVDGVGAAAHFSGPRHMTTDGRYLYVADFGGNTIRKIDPVSGEVKTIAGQPAQAVNATGPIASATLRLPSGITYDAKWGLIVATAVAVFRIH